jgi:hypothetical protein
MERLTSFVATTLIGAIGFARRASLASFGAPASLSAIGFVRHASLASLGEEASSGAISLIITICSIGAIDFVRCDVIGLVRNTVMSYVLSI